MRRCPERDRTPVVEGAPANEASRTRPGGRDRVILQVQSSVSGTELRVTLLDNSGLASHAIYVALVIWCAWAWSVRGLTEPWPLGLPVVLLVLLLVSELLQVTSEGVLVLPGGVGYVLDSVRRCGWKRRRFIDAREVSYVTLSEAVTSGDVRFFLAFALLPGEGTPPDKHEGLLAVPYESLLPRLRLHHLKRVYQEIMALQPKSARPPTALPGFHAPGVVQNTAQAAAVTLPEPAARAPLASAAAAAAAAAAVPQAAAGLSNTAQRPLGANVAAVQAEEGRRRGDTQLVGPAHGQPHFDVLGVKGKEVAEAQLQLQEEEEEEAQGRWRQAPRRRRLRRQQPES